MHFDSKYKPILVKEHQPWILYLIIAVHYVWAISIHQNSMVSALFILVGLDFLARLGIDGDALSTFLFTISTLALIGLLFEDNLGRWKSLLLLTPQYTVLFFAFLSDMNVLLTANVHCRIESATCINGIQHVDRWIIAAVLGMFMTAALLHTAAILERYIFRWYQPADFGIKES